MKNFTKDLDMIYIKKKVNIYAYHISIKNKNTIFLISDFYITSINFH